MSLPRPPESTVVSRYAVPLGIPWAGLMLSAFVHSKLPPDVPLDSIRATATFVAVPALSILGFAVIRGARRGIRADNARGEDLVVAWVMTFLLGVHCLVLALALGVIASLDRALPWATCLLYLGLGPVLAALEHGSAMGIRTPATLSSPATWARAHRRAGWWVALGGCGGLAALGLEGWPARAVAVAPGLAGLAAAIVSAILAPHPRPNGLNNSAGSPVHDSEENAPGAGSDPGSP